MKKKFLLLLLIFSTISYSQGIKVDTTALSIPQLVRNELLKSSCYNETNFKYSSHLAIGQFTNTNAGFPISDGIILRNGIAKNTEGPYDGTNLSSLSSQISMLGDVDLQTISNKNGQSGPITDVAYIEFDFTPISSKFSFDFLFAANEYGQYQCRFSDVIAFLLTDLTTGIQTNMAVIPGTTTPVSVKNIRDIRFNSSCLSSNPNLFDVYNVTNPASSAINMRGETVLLTASSTVVPNRTYRIKLAIGDYNDSNYDSAVFIRGGSFTSTADLGPDKTICQGENILLDSKLGSQFNFSWTINGVPIPGETQSKITVSQPGTYAIIATLPLTGCVIMDEVIISDFLINSPNDLTVCNTGQPTFQYDLTQNNLVTLGVSPTDYSIMYFDSLANANANGPQIPTAQLTSYTSPGNQKIYIKLVHITNGNTICNNLISFNLKTNSTVASTPSNLQFCSNSTQTVNLDWQSRNKEILNGQNPSNYAMSYYTSQFDAQNKLNVISSPNTFPATVAQSPKTIWARMENVSSNSCFDIVSFTIFIYPQPLVDDIADIIECTNYTLPVITNGNYYTGPNGTGTKLFAGDIINKTGTYYIFNGPIAPNGCTNENTFTATFIDNLVILNTGCGKYTVPNPPAGGFFTGPSGTGTLIPPGTILNFNQTIYYYAVIKGFVCRDEPIVISITLPLIDNPIDVITCNSYTLPTLTYGNYFTGSGGTGTPLNAGDVISSSQNVYVYLVDGFCISENMFKVDIVNTSVFKPINACVSYTLPSNSIGHYYNQPLGGGAVIPDGTVIKSSQTIYYYIPATTFPNCSDNLSFQITINPLPLVDTPTNRLECGSYTLPVLTHGNYYTETRGGGTPLKAGDVITTTQTIYIFAFNGIGCDSEHSFLVEIRAIPPVDSFIDVFTCTDFVLPTLTNGSYYSATDGPHGSGSTIASGTIISTKQLIYIYNEWSDFTSCKNESFFFVDFEGVNVGTFPDLNECDSYKLPVLAVGKYYSKPNGQGPIIPVGTVLTTSQTIYVYEKTGVRLTCSDQDDFRLTISTTPVLTKQADVEVCSSYSLPPLVLGTYFSGPNGTGTTYLAGQQITASQKMYVFASSPTNTDCFDEDQFQIIVHPLNDKPIDVIACNSYTLPALSYGNYFTGSGGTGTPLNAGDIISSSQNVYVYLNDGFCINENMFRVDVVDISTFKPISACVSYTLPSNPVGHYYDQPLGGGTLIPDGTVIKSSQTIYYYTPTSVFPNCFDNLSFQITINPLPLVDTPTNRLECGSYTLPVLTHGNYFTQTNGGGTPLMAGDVITTTQTIYAFATNGNCTSEHSFLVEIRALPAVDSFIDVFCTDFVLPPLTNGVYYTATDGPHGFGSTIAAGTIILKKQLIYIYNEWSDFASCKNESFFSVDFEDVNVGTFPDLNECDSYKLPPLAVGKYYSQPNGQGPIIPVGTVLTTSQTIYVYEKTGVSLSCSDQDDFMLTISTTPVLTKQPDVEVCGSYTLPLLVLGAYFSSPNGTGTTYLAGQQITSSQKMYVFASSSTNTDCFDEDQFQIIVHPLNDKPIDVIASNSYTLPTLTYGNYFTGSGGTGTPLNAGDVISSSQNVYVYLNDGFCINENMFRVDVVDISTFKPIIACVSYILPSNPIGHYYNQPLGGGTLIPDGTVIKSSQTIYYYTPTTTFPNYTDNLSFQITINPLPLVDTPANRLECGSYTLPVLTHGNYFTQTNGGGTPLLAGDVITTTQTIYTFADNGDCTSEHSFQVEIRTLPAVDSFIDVFCTDFVLPPLTNGAYYTATDGPHGSGSIIAAGTIISTKQLIYIYNEWSDFSSCRNESFFSVDFDQVNVGTFPDLNECDSYKLPTLAVGKYYSQPNGQGPIIPVGTVLTTSQTIYVYEKYGTSLSCSDQDDFMLTISTTPVLTKKADIEVCGSYTLPPLVLGTYFSGPNGTGTTYLAGQKITASQKMYVFASSPTNTDCFDEDQFQIIVHSLNNLTIPSGAICVDFNTGALINPFQLVSGLTPAVFNVNWYLNGTLIKTGTNYTATQEGIYEVNIIKKTPDIGNNCGYNPTSVIVEKSSVATATLTVSGVFEDVIDIIVNVTGGFGTYEYQMDNNSFQTDNVFHNAPSGEHKITINDVKGDCGAITLIADVLKYPKFFTPNGDGFNDTWNIWSLANQPDDLIYIYDRYGKLLKQLSPAGEGWEGDYNGHSLPSTDYWFQVFYKNNNVPQEFKAHFSIKR